VEKVQIGLFQPLRCDDGKVGKDPGRMEGDA
jgi:hypothetical protein